MSRPTAIVIGGGFTGAMQAVQLLRAGAARVTLIERSGRPGRGVAYGTDRPEHLLNVPAARMSAFPDDPDHFARWFARFGGAPDDFAPRRLYGDYVEEIVAAAPEGLEIVRGEVVAVEKAGAGERVLLASGETVEADAAILALGNLPAPESPWAADPAAGLGPEDSVLLIGTGLTAVDVALTLDANGFGGRILALSRRGLKPRAHAAGVAPAEPATATLDSRGVKALRRQAAAIGWRAAVDGLRPVTSDIWRAASLEQRSRFLRHLRPWWDVHRHRIAPQIAERIEAMEAEGRLTFAAGRVVGQEDGLVHWRPRGSDDIQAFAGTRIFNCTGPALDIERAGDPLLDRLLDAGRIRPDPLRIGIDVDAECRVVGNEGTASDSLYAVGPQTRGLWWEIVAVPDIRVQVERLARQIAG